MKIEEITSKKFIYVCHHFATEDLDAALFVSRYLEESGRRKDFGRGHSVVFHRAHIPDTQDHLHFFAKQKELYALNRDGTAHDSSHGARLHNWAMDAIKRDYKGFVIPPKGLIESSLLVADPSFLVEAYVTKVPLVPANLILAAENILSL